MMHARVPLFEQPDLAGAVENLQREEIDALPFGAIRLDGTGKVAFYSAAERRLSGFDGNPLSRPFFDDIAPCMNNAAFRGRIERALAAGTLDIAFDHIGDFADRTRAIRVRVQAANGGGCWIFMEREE